MIRSLLYWLGVRERPRPLVRCAQCAQCAQDIHYHPSGAWCLRVGCCCEVYQ